MGIKLEIQRKNNNEKVSDQCVCVCVWGCMKVHLFDDILQLTVTVKFCFENSSLLSEKCIILSGTQNVPFTLNLKHSLWQRE